MIRSPPAPRPCSRRSPPNAAKLGVFLGLRALLAFLLAALQLASALHFTLVPHSFSAALGGVVHVHGAAERGRARAEPRAVSHSARTRTLVADTLACAVDLCPFADAPHGSPPCVEATLSGVASFGAPALLSEAVARSASSRRIFSRAPKTSPPV